MGNPPFEDVSPNCGFSIAMLVYQSVRWKPISDEDSFSAKWHTQLLKAGGKGKTRILEFQNDFILSDRFF